MQVINTPISPYLQNAPIAYCEETNKCIFIDPGDELDKLIQVQMELKLIPEYIFITHGHIDHAGAAKELATKLNLNIIGPHIDDSFLLESLEMSLSKLSRILSFKLVESVKFVLSSYDLMLFIPVFTIRFCIFLLFNKFMDSLGILPHLSIKFCLISSTLSLLLVI